MRADVAGRPELDGEAARERRVERDVELRPGRELELAANPPGTLPHRHREAARRRARRGRDRRQEVSSTGDAAVSS